MSAEYVIAFVDGLNDILPKKYDIRKLDENSEVNIDIDFEKLYKKMVEYRADHLYTLKQWDNIFDETNRRHFMQNRETAVQLLRAKNRQKRSMSLRQRQKYKKCCGANL